MGCKLQEPNWQDGEGVEVEGWVWAQTAAQWYIVSPETGPQRVIPAALTGLSYIGGPAAAKNSSAG